VNNFIQNAIEASPSQNSKITIRCTKLISEKNMFEITVIDHGIGIPADILKRLGNEVISYAKDNQVDPSHNSGSGIALYNAKIDIQKHGGELLIKSQIGSGTQVSIRICAD
jgi:signal transduction histidine kinase